MPDWKETVGSLFIHISLPVFAFALFSSARG
jgi:hypothetical protein